MVILFLWDILAEKDAEDAKDAAAWVEATSENITILFSHDIQITKRAQEFKQVAIILEKELQSCKNKSNCLQIIEKIRKLSQNFQKFSEECMEKYSIKDDESGEKIRKLSI